MEEIKVNGIVLNSMAYKDNDILLHLFTPEIGKITCILKGAKGAKAKLKWASLPFCFCEWVLVKRGEFYVVTNVSCFDTFFDITKDYDTYLISSMMLEVTNAMLKPNIFADQMFVNLANTLKNIVYSDINPRLLVAKYLLDATEFLGYKPNFNSCEVCGMPIASDILLSYDTHNFSCRNCCSGYGMLVSRQQYNALKIISNTPSQNLSSVKINNDVLLAVLNMLRFDLESILEIKIKSFVQVTENI